jgi:hypothetical protein
MNRQIRCLTLGFILATIGSLAVASWLYETHPGLRRSLVHEGGFVQSATACLFFASFLLGLLSLSQIAAPLRREFAWIPTAGVFGWLEESDYGERLFHFHPPLLFNKHIDSLHSLIGALLLPFKRSAHVDLLQSILWVTLGFLAIRHRVVPRVAAFTRRHPAWRFALLAAGLILVAQLIDDRVLRWRDSHVMEEILELDGAVGMLIAAALIGWIPVPGKAPLIDARSEVNFEGNPKAISEAFLETLPGASGSVARTGSGPKGS